MPAVVGGPDHGAGHDPVRADAAGAPPAARSQRASSGDRTSSPDPRRRGPASSGRRRPALGQHRPVRPEHVVEPAAQPVDQHRRLRQQGAGQPAIRPRRAARPAARRRSGGVPAGGAARRPRAPAGRASTTPAHGGPARPPPVISLPTSCGHADQRAGVRRALGLVGVEQRVVGAPGQHVGELPGQLVHVAQAERRGPGR